MALITVIDQAQEAVEFHGASTCRAGATFQIDESLLAVPAPANGYSGCGNAFAAVVDGKVVALAYRDGRAAINREELAALSDDGVIFAGTASCCEFVIRR